LPIGILVETLLTVFALGGVHLISISIKSWGALHARVICAIFACGTRFTACRAVFLSLFAGIAGLA
jgi:hypothetical protein